MQAFSFRPITRTAGYKRKLAVPSSQSLDIRTVFQVVQPGLPRAPGGLQEAQARSVPQLKTRLRDPKSPEVGDDAFQSCET